MPLPAPSSIQLDPELLSEPETDSDFDFEVTDEMAAKARLRSSEPDANTELLESAIQKLQTMTTLPWAQTLSLAVESQASDDIEDFNDDLKREVSFYNQTLMSVRLAKDLCKEHSIPWQRPHDYYAEMVKDDRHMDKIRTKMLQEKKRIETAQKRRKEREQKRFAKQIQAQQNQKKSLEKKEAIKNVAEFKDSDAGKKRRSNEKKRPGKQSRHNMRLKGRNI
ncbi:hypothetical protein P9112_007782 [Eukaryota sp. TZLM1-RC]